jgi:hypothetical protein
MSDMAGQAALFGDTGHPTRVLHAVRCGTPPAGQTAAEVAELLALVGSEPGVIDRLKDSVDQLGAVRDAKDALAKLTADEVRAGLAHRRNMMGTARGAR